MDDSCIRVREASPNFHFSSLDMAQPFRCPLRGFVLDCPATPAARIHSSRGRSTGSTEMQPLEAVTEAHRGLGAVRYAIETAQRLQTVCWRIINEAAVFSAQEQAARQPEIHASAIDE